MLFVFIVLEIIMYFVCTYLFYNYLVANTCTYKKQKNVDLSPQKYKNKYYYKLYFKNEFLHKFLVSLLLLAMLLIYSGFKIHIPVEYLISKNLIPK